MANKELFVDGALDDGAPHFLAFPATPACESRLWIQSMKLVWVVYRLGTSYRWYWWGCEHSAMWGGGGGLRGCWWPERL